MKHEPGKTPLRVKIISCGWDVVNTFLSWIFADSVRPDKALRGPLEETVWSKKKEKGRRGRNLADGRWSLMVNWSAGSATWIHPPGFRPKNLTAVYPLSYFPVKTFFTQECLSLYLLSLGKIPSYLVGFRTTQLSAKTMPWSDPG